MSHCRWCRILFEKLIVTQLCIWNPKVQLLYDYKKKLLVIVIIIIALFIRDLQICRFPCITENTLALSLTERIRKEYRNGIHAFPQCVVS